MDEIVKSKITRSGPAVALIALVAFALFIRMQFIVIYGNGLNYLSWAKDNYFYGMIVYYLNGASSILNGQGYSYLTYPPGYSLFLAAAKYFGALGLGQLQLLQAFIDSLSVLGIYWLLRRTSAPRTFAFLGAGLYAFFGEWAAGSTMLLADWISPPLIVWLLLLIVLASERRSIWLWAAVGGVIAFGTLTRPDLLLLIIPAILCAVLLGKPSITLRTKAVAMLLCAFVLPIGSWGLYNYVHHGHWVFTSTGGGNGLWEGLGDTPNPYGFALNDSKAMQILSDHGLKWHSAEADRFFKRKYLEGIIAHPLYALGVVAWRWKQIASVVDFGFWAQVCTGAQLAIKEYFEKAGFWILLVAVVISRRRPISLLMLLLPLFYAFFSIGLVHYEPRYVRYAHLSYLFASIVLLAALFRYLSRKKTPWPKRSLAIAVGCVAFYGVGQYVPTLYGVAQVYGLELQDAKGQLTKVSDLSKITFTPVVKNEVTKQSDGSLLVRTDRGSFSYQLLAVIPVKAADFLYVRYKIQLIKGGFTIGLLSSSGHWLTQRSHVTSGLKDGFIGIKVDGQKSVTLVIANNCPNKCQSEFELQRLDVDVEK